MTNGEPRKTAEEILRTNVGEAIGESSMCWSEIPKGIFDSTRALKITEELLADIVLYRISPGPERDQLKIAIGALDRIFKYEHLDSFSFKEAASALDQIKALNLEAQGG